MPIDATNCDIANGDQLESLNNSINDTAANDANSCSIVENAKYMPNANSQR